MQGNNSSVNMIDCSWLFKTRNSGQRYLEKEKVSDTILLEITASRFDRFTLLQQTQKC